MALNKHKKVKYETVTVPGSWASDEQKEKLNWISADCIVRKTEIDSQPEVIDELPV